MTRFKPSVGDIVLFVVSTNPEPAIVTFVWSDTELDLAVLFDCMRFSSCDPSSAHVLYMHHTKRGKPGEFERWWPRPRRNP